MYLFICITTLVCWLTAQTRIVVPCLVLTIIVGVVTKAVTPLGALMLAVTGLVSYFCSRFRSPVFPIVFAILAVGLMTHQLPGFNNIKYFDKVQFSAQSTPFTMYLNFDKPFVGLFLLAFSQIARGPQNLDLVFKKSLPAYLALTATILPTAFLLNYVVLDPKVPNWLWAVNNLLIVCVAEETFFRGFVQQKFERLWGVKVAIIAAAVLFGIAHIAGGSAYVALSTFAGLFYGWSYSATRRIEAPILVHFLLNLTHFSLFTYPALK